jgi:hypothetical protein
MAKRVLVVEIQAQTQGATTFATWNPSDKSANIALSGGNLIASSAIAVGQSVRSTLSFEPGSSYYFETTWNSGADLYVGIGNASASLSQAPGGNASSWSIRCGTGQKVTSGSSSAYTGAIGAGGTVGVTLEWQPESSTWSLYFTTSGLRNSTAAFTGLSGTLFAMVGSATAFNATANFGASPFVHLATDGALPGVVTRAAPSSSTLYVASEGFATDSAATPASTWIDGRIPESSSPYFERSVKFWPWGGSSSSGVGDIALSNADGGLDAWRDLIVRDRPVIIRYGTREDAIADPSALDVLATVIGERLQYEGATVRLVTRDRMAILDRPIVTETYPATAVAEAVRETPRPLLLGKCWSVDPVQYDTTQRLFDLTDSGGLWSVSEVSDQADPDTLTTDYTVEPSGFRKLAAPVGRMAATATGGFADGAVALNEPFDSWASSGSFDANPAGWTTAGDLDANNRVYQSTAGVATFVKNGGATTLSITRAIGLAAGTTYALEVTVASWASGHVSFHSWNGATESSEIFRVDGKARLGVPMRIPFTVTAGYSSLRVKMLGGSSGNVSLASIRVVAVTAVERLPAMISELLGRRLGLSSSTEFDLAGATTIDAAAPYPLGLFSRAPILYSDALRQALDSFAAAAFTARDGRIKFARLAEPSTSSVVTITDTELATQPVALLDAAKGLRTLLGARRNWVIHSDADFATSVSAETRARLSAQFQFVRKAVGIVAPEYAHADTSEPKGTLFQNAADARTEAARMATLYRVPRWFYSCSAYLDDSIVYQIEPGDTVTLKTNRFDLAAGKRLLVVSTKTRAFDNLIDFVLWG